MQTLHHKKNTQGMIEFTNSFENKYLYLKELNAEVLFELSMEVKDSTVFIPSPCTISGTTLHYIRECWQDNCPESSFVFLDDITPNLSKYIPEDNAVLFLSEGDYERHEESNHEFVNRSFVYDDQNIKSRYNKDLGFRGEIYASDEDGDYYEYYNKCTLFVDCATHTEFQKANEVAKELKEKYGVEEVNLFVLHWFCESKECDVISFLLYNKIFNKIITTNSTGILPVQNIECLQVIDCEEIFEEYLKDN